MAVIPNSEQSRLHTSDQGTEITDTGKIKLQYKFYWYDMKRSFLCEKAGNARDVQFLRFTPSSTDKKWE